MKDEQHNGQQVNGHRIDPHGESTEPRRRSIVRALVQDFSPVWVTWSMNLGILAILMHILPYQFNGLRTISAVLFVAALVVFILCITLISLRFILYGKAAWNEITSDVNELCFMACFPISWMTVTSLTVLIVSNASWGGHPFTIVGYVMYWISVFAVLFLGVGIYVILTIKQLTEARTLTLSIILPAVATSTAALEGGVLALYAKDISADLAVPVIIVSFMLVGIGFFVAILISALFLQRILATSWYDGIKRPTLMILLGPTGQSAAALLVLSDASTLHFPQYERGTALQPSVAAALHGACLLFALMLFGLGVFWTLWGVYAIIDAVVRREAKWTPAWYSTVFPTGTMNTALVLFSEQFDSPAFRVLATGLLILLTINLLLNAFYTIRGIARRQILILKDDPRQKKEG